MVVAGRVRRAPHGIRPETIALDAFDSYIANDVARLEPLIKSIGVKQ